MIKQKVVLVIDDDKLSGSSLENLLIRNNYFAVIANSGAEGLQKAFDVFPDLIICAIKMKHIDGFKVIKILKQNSTSQQIPFIFLTASFEKEEARLAMQLGAQDYIAKPVNCDDLLGSLEIILEKKDLFIENAISDLNSMMYLMPDSMIIFEEGGIVDFNGFTTELLGFDRMELLGKPLCELIPLREQPLATDSLRRIYMGLSDHGKMDIVIKRKNDTRIEVEFSYYKTSLFEAKPHFIGIIKPKSVKQAVESNSKPVLSLSRREADVMKLSCEGLLIKEIAEKLFISDRTVEKHRASVMEKTGSRNIVEALIHLIKLELVVI